jgi:glycosyltransferase involved in cell wall biosynthesis
MPVEAMALGTPVVARDVGGGSETVLDGVTGAHLREGAGRQELRACVERAISSDGVACRDRAQTFAVDRFVDRLRSWIGDSA